MRAPRASGPPNTEPAGPHEEAYARLVAAADATYTGSIGRAVDLLGTDALSDQDGRLAELRRSSGEAEREHARALDAAVAALEPALTANMQEIAALGARDQADGTAFTAESVQRHEQLVAARARLMTAAIAPGCYAQSWHSDLMDSVTRAANPVQPTMG